MNLRKARLSDLRELQEIGINSYLPHYAHMWKTGGLDWYLHRCFSEEFLREEIIIPDVEYYIASFAKQDIGILKLVLHKPLPDSDTKDALYLEKIYFIKEWTGKGAGQELMNFTVERAKKVNCKCVWLVAMDTAEKPVRAYQKAGFIIHSHKLLDFELMKNEYKGTFVMKKYLETNDN